MEGDLRETVLKLKEEGSVFRLYTDEELELILPYLAMYEYPAGVIVMQAGEVIDMLGVLVSGEVLLEEEMKLKGNWTVLYDMKRGSILAHPTVFGAKPPLIRLTTRKDCVFVGFDKAGFEAFLEKHPRMGILLLKEIIRVLFVRSRALAERLTDIF